MSTANPENGQERVRLRKNIQCPHCWSTFSPKEILWIAESSELRSDIRLRDEPIRFLPTRFSPQGHALDAREKKCDLLACPRCHLGVPRSLLEFPAFAISIFGGPSSGKSFFLGAMTGELRRVLPALFKIGFNDADTTSNVELHSYEKSIFHGESEETVPLGTMIPKTVLTGSQYYDRVQFGDHEEVLSRSFTFALRPRDTHTNAERARNLSRTICLYDNSGEHFRAGMDAESVSITRVMAESQSLLFTFDPTQDIGFRRQCRKDDRLGAFETVELDNQIIILQEAISRIQRYSGLRHSQKYDKPLIVVLTKCDAWAPLLEVDDFSEPWQTGDADARLSLTRIREMSKRAKAMMELLCPQLVETAEGFSDDVLYVPISSVGFDCTISDDRRYAIQPEQINPTWVTVPFLYSLFSRTRGLVIPS